jgi:hypothetical protein
MMAVDIRKQRRARNLALAGALVAFATLVFILTIVKMSLLK